MKTSDAVSASVKFSLEAGATEELKSFLQRTHDLVVLPMDLFMDLGECLLRVQGEVAEALCEHDDGDHRDPAWRTPCVRMVYGSGWMGNHQLLALVTASLSAGGAMIEQDASGKHRLIIPLE